MISVGTITSSQVSDLANTIKSAGANSTYTKGATYETESIGAALNTLNGDALTAGSVAKSVADAVSNLTIDSIGSVSGIKTSSGIDGNVHNYIAGEDITSGSSQSVTIAQNLAALDAAIGSKATLISDYTKSKDANGDLSVSPADVATAIQNVAVNAKDALDLLNSDDTVAGSVANSIKTQAQNASFTVTSAAADTVLNSGTGGNATTVQAALNTLGEQAKINTDEISKRKISITNGLATLEDGTAANTATVYTKDLADTTFAQLGHAATFADVTADGITLTGATSSDSQTLNAAKIVKYDNYDSRISTNANRFAGFTDGQTVAQYVETNTVKGIYNANADYASNSVGAAIQTNANRFDGFTTGQTVAQYVTANAKDATYDANHTIAQAISANAQDIADRLVTVYDNTSAKYGTADITDGTSTANVYTVEGANAKFVAQNGAATLIS